MTHRWRRIAVVFLLGVSPVIGCGDGSDTLTLDTETDELDPRFERIRERLDIVAQAVGGYTGSGECTTTSCSASGLAAAIERGCGAQATPSRTAATANGCANGVIEAERQICTAHRLLELVESPAPRNVFVQGSSEFDPGGTLRFPPQDSESYAEMARWAHVYAARTLSTVDNTFDTSRVTTCANSQLDDAAGTVAPLTTITLGEELAHFYREALEVAMEAAEYAQQNGAARSDAARSRATDRAEAAYEALAPSASRTFAAHLTAGGGNGLPGLTAVAGSGFFTRPGLSGEAQHALDLLRAAAVNPAHVSNASRSIDDLVQGTNGVTTQDSVRYRLGLMQNQQDLLSSTGVAATYRMLGVSRSAFSEAREFLREEIAAFDRSTTAVVPAERVTGGTPGATTATYSVTLYAATRNPPQQPSPLFWSSVVRHDPSAPIFSGNPYPDYNTPPPWEYRPDANGYLPPGHTFGTESINAATQRVVGERTLASVLDQAWGRGPAIMNRLCPSTCTGALQRARDIVAGSYAMLTGAASPSGQPTTRYESGQVLGRARACWYNWTATTGTQSDTYDVRLDVEGPFQASELLVVRGREGLECAVEGTVDGAPCAALTSYLPNSTVWGTATVSLRSVLTTRLFDEKPTGRPAANSVGIYVVRRRAGLTGTSGPGQYEELAGWVLPASSYNIGAGQASQSYRYCQTTLISPLVDEQVTTAVAPATTGTGDSATSCAGVASDLRIPLENELTDDGNGIESSWRYYLNRAREAAADADALGEDMIRSGLEMDIRAEQAADELNRLCGVSVNVTSIADAMAADTGNPAVEAATGTPAVCRNGYNLQVTEGATRCVRDPVLYAATFAARDDDYQRLASCIGADVVEWTTLGDSRLCIWDSNGSAPGGVCDGATPARPCPIEADSNGLCTSTNVLGSWLPATEFVGIFRRPADPEPPPPDPNDLPCLEVAKLRANQTLTPEEEARLSTFLTYDGVSRVAQQLSWEAMPGNYSAVRYANSIVFRTGTVTQPPGLSSQWPMGDAPTGYCPAGYAATNTTSPSLYTGPLFCFQRLASETGTDRLLRRAQMNDLLARAVLAVRVFTGSDLAGTVFPYYAANGASCYSTDRDSFDWDFLTGSNPSTSCANLGRFYIDHSGSDLADPYSRDFADLGIRTCSVGSAFRYEGNCNPLTQAPDRFGAGSGTHCILSVPEHAEWARCPYDRIICDEIFDDAVDCDDQSATGWDRNMSLILREADPQVRVDAAAVPAEQYWRQVFVTDLRRSGRLTPAQLRQPVTAAHSQVSLSRLTHYFDRYTNPGAEYEHEAGSNPTHRLLQDGNRAFIGAGGLTRMDLFNGIELACVGARQQVPSIDSSCLEPPPIEDMSGALRMAQYLECQANALDTNGSTTLFANLPRRVVDALRQDGVGTYGSGAGEVDAQIDEIRASLIDLTNFRHNSAADARAFASRVRTLRSAVARSQRARDIEDLMRLGRGLDRITQCVTASATVASTDVAGLVGKTVAAAATCTNSIAQVILDDQINALRDADIEAGLLDEFERFNVDSAEFGRRASERLTQLRSSLERIDSALSRLRANQQQARRALARALMLDSDGAGGHFAVNRVFRARYNTLLIRYRRAHMRAQRSAYIARLALEQRLGMRLSDMEDDVFSDDPPASWVDEICTMPSIDYDELRAIRPGATGEREGDGVAFQGPVDYSGSYVGDYVERLEDVFDSFSFVHPFREGTDTAVVSLRDDIFRTRAPCPTLSPNLLYNGGRLDRLEGADRGGWRVSGCSLTAVPVGGDRQCAAITPHEIDPLAPAAPLAMPTPVSDSDFGRPTPYTISFGDGATTTAATRVEQVITLETGRYRLSWWARTPASGAAGITPSDAVRVRNYEDTAEIYSGTGRIVFPTSPAPASWTRYWMFFDLATDATVRVTIPYGTVPGGGVVARAVDVTGLMLEDVSASIHGTVTSAIGQALPPSPFFESGDTGMRDLRTCRDDTGIWFRRESFAHACTRVCADGYDSDCPPDLSETRCFRHTSFDISSRTLERLLGGSDAGFASGNYNYRVESVGVNLVGTGLRDCGASGTSGCYGSGTFAFSVLHAGPFTVVNARGASYDAPLFPGRIESARALAAERYLTNPMSSADTALIQPLTRDELGGRPLGGTLLLRLWDDPALAFERLEDIQLVLRYRYWQHQR